MSIENIEYIQTKTNLMTIQVDGYLLHSKYNPVKEAEKIAINEIDEQYVHLLYGYGQGYIAEAIYSKLEEKNRLIVFEPILELYENIGKKDYQVFNDIEQFEKSFENLCSEFDRKVKIVLSPNYDKFEVDIYQKVLKVVKTIQSESIVNENTLRFFSDVWQENYLKNLLPVFESPTLKDLEAKYTCPVVIASGGPSLTKQLPLLKKMRSQILLLASGSTINSLLAANIEPDYIVSIDGGEANYEHFKSIEVTKAKLIYALSNNYKIQENFPNTRYSFIYSSEERMRDHINFLLNKELPTIFAGGTVAVSALHIATYISSGPIALIGQDLAYTGRKSHAENNKFYQELEESFFESRGAFEVEGYDGKPILTDFVFSSMRKTFENVNEILMKTSDIYNCTEGGVKIRGMQQKTFQSFYDCYVSNDKVDILESKLMKKNYKDFIISMQREIKRYHEIKSLLKEAINLVKKNTLTTEFSVEIIKSLDKIDKKLKKLYDRVLMERIIEPITIDVLRNFQAKKDETSSEAYQRVYNQNLELYQRVLEATEITERFTKQIIEKAKFKDKGE